MNLTNNPHVVVTTGDTVTDAGFGHPDAGGHVLVFAVEPTKVLAFAKGTFSQTRYLPRR